MAYVVLIYDRTQPDGLTDEYARQAHEWVQRILRVPGAVSFMGYRALEGSPNTMSMTEFKTVDDAKTATASREVEALLNEMEAYGTRPRLMIMERSPLTPQPISL